MVNKIGLDDSRTVVFDWNHKLGGLAGVAPLVSCIDLDPKVDIVVGHPRASDDILMESPKMKLPFCHIRRDSQDIALDDLFRKANRYPVYGSSSKRELMNELTLGSMHEAANLANKELMRQVWEGTGINREMQGLDKLVRIGNSRLDPAGKGIAMKFKGANIVSESPDIVVYLSNLMWHLRCMANRYHLNPVTWVLAMRPEVWWNLAEVVSHRYTTFRPDLQQAWTCEYCGSDGAISLTQCLGNCGGSRPPAPGQYVCLYCGRVYHSHKSVCWDTDSGTGCGAIEAMIQINDVDGLMEVIEGHRKLFDWMMEEGKITIDGSLYDVVVDDYIPEGSNGVYGVRWSNIYAIPMTVVGGLPVTLMEYADQQVHGCPYDGNRFWTDSGIYLWQLEQDHWNYRLGALTEARIVMRCPQLSGMVEEVGYVVPVA